VNKILMEVVPDMPDAPWKAVNASAVAASPSAAEELALDMPEIGVPSADEEDEAMAALQARAEAL
jgi:hypothetical protein